MNVQHLDMTAGEDRTFPLAGRDASNAPFNLTGRSISWRVGRAPGVRPTDNPLFTKTGTVVSAPAGTFTVPVVGDDTVLLPSGDYRHEAWAITDGGASTLVSAGRLKIRGGLEP